MAESFRDDLRIPIGLQRDCRVRVPETVRCEARYAACLHEFHELLRKTIGVNRSSQFISEEIVAPLARVLPQPGVPRVVASGAS
jgi:hypothetical protein